MNHLTFVPKQSLFVLGNHRAGKSTMITFHLNNLLKHRPDSKILVIVDQLSHGEYLKKSLIELGTNLEVTTRLTIHAIDDKLLISTDYTDIIFLAGSNYIAGNVVAFYSKPNYTILNLLNEYIKDPKYSDRVVFECYPASQITENLNIN